MRQVRTMVGVMAMDTAQSAGFASANSFWFLSYGRGRKRRFGDHRLREHDFNHGMNAGQLRTSMGGVIDDIT